MTLPIARDLSRSGVRVLIIAPGNPLFEHSSDEVRDSLGKMTSFSRRLGKPNEYALLAKSMIENPMLNGETIRLDGAIRMEPKKTMWSR